MNLLSLAVVLLALAGVLYLLGAGPGPCERYRLPGMSDYAAYERCRRH